jgi:hypothetical protein
MTDLESKCDELYASFGDLPSSSSKEYSIWYSKHEGDYSTRIIINKEGKSAKDIWNQLSVKYFKFPEIELSKKNHFKTHLWHNIFSRKYFIIDEDKNRKTTAYIPWYSFLLRPLLGGHIIITRMKENYHSGL